jgi:ATP-dependent DNA ligase
MYPDEIKHDGYRLIVRRDGDTVRLFTRRDRRPAGAGQHGHAARTTLAPVFM